MTLTLIAEKGLTTRNKPVKYECSITYIPKVMANVEVFSRQTDTVKNR